MMKTSEQQDTVISHRNIANKGKKKQRKEAKAATEPRMNFLRNKEEHVKRLQDHKHENVEKMTGEKLIIRRESTPPDKDPAQANLAEVSRI